jgi:hypothetical protein
MSRGAVTRPWWHGPGGRPLSCRPMRSRLALHLSLWVVGAAVLRVAVVPAEVCPSVTSAEARAAIDEAVGWFERGIDESGRYTYGYDRGAGELSLSYNDARHAGVTMSLYQVAIEHDPGVLFLADRGLRFMMERTVRAGDGAGWRVYSSGDLPLGANSLFLAALALRREATGDESYDEVMRGVGRFLLGQQLEDGNMLAYWSPATGAPLPGVTGKFATGEAAWALTLLDRAFPGEGWAEAALPTIDYLNERRDREEGRVSRLPDHWAAYALSELDEVHRSDERMSYARQLAGYFGIRLRFESQRRGEGLNLAVRWFPGPPAGVGTAGEGIGALRRLALDDSRIADLLPNIEARLTCTAGFMVERQATAAEAASYPDPGLVRGAWFYRGYTQMDDQQHVISALLAALPVLDAAEGG